MTRQELVWGGASMLRSGRTPQGKLIPMIPGQKLKLKCDHLSSTKTLHTKRSELRSLNCRHEKWSCHVRQVLGDEGSTHSRKEENLDYAIISFILHHLLLFLNFHFWVNIWLFSLVFLCLELIIVLCAYACSTAWSVLFSLPTAFPFHPHFLLSLSHSLLLVLNYKCVWL